MPRQPESAGKHHGSTTRRGDSQLRGAWGEAAARSNNTYLQPRYRHIPRHRDKKRALITVGHSILITIQHMTTNDVDYTDPGADYCQLHQNRRQTTTHLINKLTQLGYHATPKDTTTTTPTQTS